MQLVFGGALALGLGVVLLCAAWFLWDRWHRVVEYRRYDGKLIFNTIEEYAEFKKAIGNPLVTDFTAQTLSSEPPVIVQFAAISTPSYELPYGNQQTYSKYDNSIGIEFLLAVGLVFALFGLLLICSYFMG